MSGGMSAGAFAMAAIATTATTAEAISTLTQGQAQSSNASYEAQVAANNATIAQQNADYARKAGEAKAQQQSLAGAQQQGMIRAAIGANNVDVNSGSAEDVQSSQRELTNLGTQTTMNNALLQAYGYQSQATSYSAQSQLYNAEADQAITGSYISAAGGLLGGASSGSGGLGKAFSGLIDGSGGGGGGAT
jgi:hypothetical protein